jgi:cytochrome c5
LRRWFAAGCFIACPLAAGAQDLLLREYSSELLLNESRAALQTGKPLRYADGDAGAALRRLLDQQRTTQVLDRFMDALRRREEVPNLLQQVGPLLNRYSKAFDQWPGEYEAEYLDSTYWYVHFGRLNLAEDPAPGPAQALGRSLRGLQVSVLSLMEQGLRNKIERNLFSPEGRERATAMADEIARAKAGPVPAPAPVRTRPVFSGKQAYDLQCMACHATGVAMAPRFGDRAAWQPRLAAGFDALVRATLDGVRRMPPHRGGALQDVEVARATAYLANSAGASFAEPRLAPGHPGVVEVREAPQAPVVRASTGESLYSAHCQACHQQGQSAGTVIPALAGAQSLRNTDAAIRMILHGRNAMPANRHLSDEDVVLVTNHMIRRFGPAGAEAATATAEEVRRLR